MAKLKRKDLDDREKRELLYDGLLKGIVMIIPSPHNDGVACCIGDYWFYFDQMKLAELLFDAIEGLREDDYSDEPDYYYAYLKERESRG